MRYAFINNEFIKESEAQISVFDSSVTTGDRVTEVARTFSHEFFHLDLHLDRLINALNELELGIGYTKQQLKEITFQLFEKNKGTELDNVEWEVIYIVTRGLESLYKLFDPSMYKPNLIVLCFPLKYRLGNMYPKYAAGYKLLVPSQRAIPHSLLAPEIKSRGRAHFKLAQIEIHTRDKEATPLLLDAEDNVTETTGANIFFIKDNILCTPPKTSVVSGITREYIMELASQLGMQVEERKISINEITEFEEAFVTSTVIGIIHVKQIEAHKYSDGSCGPKTTRIRQLFCEKVGVDFVKQVELYAEALRK